MKTDQLDCIIVGQGLAGSALAVQFLLRKKKVLVFDQPSKNNSSAIAAGLFNPVTGKKMGKTWLADELFPYLVKFYTQVEAITKTKFFHSIPIYRPFRSITEQNEWMGASVDDNLSGFIKSVFTSGQYPELLDEFGGLLLESSGYINTKQYIAAVREWLREEESYRDELFDYNNLEINEAGVRYKDYTASYIAFCDGVKFSSNNFFNWLPIRPLKGETLLVEAKFLNDVLVNRGVYIVPEGQNRWRIGSTYRNDFEGVDITREGKEELTTNLESLVKINYQVIEQAAGVRPVTSDRRPILGRHPNHPTVLIFNGMGTKGVSLSPYFSEVLIRSLDNSGVINKEVDINRYKSLYWNSR